MSSSFDDDSNIVCRLCRRQIARYTCPQCNIPYCSSTCFKSPAHANCSESFYKKQIEADARSGSTSNAKPTPTQTQERLKMMEILRRFEEEDNDNLEQFGEEDGDGDEEEDDEDDIAKRLAGIDIGSFRSSYPHTLLTHLSVLRSPFSTLHSDIHSLSLSLSSTLIATHPSPTASASPNLLWSLLSDSERAQFVKSIQDPSSALSQELLLSDELRREVTYRPWWEPRSQDDLTHQHPLLSLIRDDHSHHQAGLGHDDTDDTRYYEPPCLPELITIPSTMIHPKPIPNGPPLIYNLCAICFAYAYTTRRIGRSPLSPASSTENPENPQDIESSGDIEDIEEAKRVLAQLIPFLIKRKSTVLYTTVADAIDDVWSKVDKSTVSTSNPNSNPTLSSNSNSENSQNSTFSVLMQDTATLLRPQPIGVLSSSSISFNPSISSSSSPSVLTTPSPSSPPGLTPSSPSSPSPSSPSSSAATAVAADIDVALDVPSHPNRNTVYVLSDLHRLFTISLGGKGEKGAHVTHKLLFYTAHVLSAPSGVLRSVADEVEAYVVRAA
ncbi:hypothetical protein C8R42DRAFT_722296 [Lentinula raphanica]|nr:hypothetical protein C8R42DRAFT_722296 [Lentinula raphanica]